MIVIQGVYELSINFNCRSADIVHIVRAASYLRHLNRFEPSHPHLITSKVRGKMGWKSRLLHIFILRNLA